MKPNRLREIIEGMTPAPWILEIPDAEKRARQCLADHFVYAEEDNPDGSNLGEEHGEGFSTYRVEDSRGITTLANLRFALVELVEACIDKAQAAKDFSEADQDDSAAMKEIIKRLKDSGERKSQALAKIEAYEE